MKIDKFKNLIRRKTGVDGRTRCRLCGITAKASFLLGPVETGIQHPEYSETYSFYKSDTGHTCPRCHRESALKGLFELMDKLS